MPSSRPDPFQTLGVNASASEQEVRSAYRRLVQKHHPDHNGGSPEATRRFEEVQEAYAEIRRLRAAEALAHARQRHRTAAASGQARTDPAVEAKIRDLERELRDAHEARDRARAAARRAQAAVSGRRASDQELGYVTTDDSFTRILADARDEILRRLSER